MHSLHPLPPSLQAKAEFVQNISPRNIDAWLARYNDCTVRELHLATWLVNPGIGSWQADAIWHSAKCRACLHGQGEDRRH